LPADAPHPARPAVLLLRTSRRTRPVPAEGLQGACAPDDGRRHRSRSGRQRHTL